MWYGNSRHYCGKMLKLIWNSRTHVWSRQTLPSSLKETPNALTARQVSGLTLSGYRPQWLSCFARQLMYVSNGLPLSLYFPDTSFKSSTTGESVVTRHYFDTRRPTDPGLTRNPRFNEFHLSFCRTDRPAANINRSLPISSAIYFIYLFCYGWQQTVTWFWLPLWRL